MAKRYGYQVIVRSTIVASEGGFLTRQDAVKEANSKRDEIRGDVWEYVKKDNGRHPYLVSVFREEV